MASNAILSCSATNNQNAAMWSSFNEATFSCAMCHQPVVEEATFLSCLHSFCIKCIPDKQYDVTCPLCTGININAMAPVTISSKNSLPKLYKRLLELSKTKSDDVIECENCINKEAPLPGAAYCINCSAVICNMELECHSKYNMQHDIYSLTDLREWTGNDILVRLRKKEKLTSSEINPPREETNFADISASRDASSCNTRIISVIGNMYILGDTCLNSMQRRLDELEEKKRIIESDWSRDLVKLNSVFDELKDHLEQRKQACITEVGTIYRDLLEPYATQIESVDNYVKLMQYYTALSAYSYISDVSSSVRHKMMGLTDSFTCLKFSEIKFKPVFDYEESIKTIKTNIDKFFKNTFIMMEIDKFIPIKFRIEQTLNFELSRINGNSAILSVDYDLSTGRFYALFKDCWKSFHCFDNGQVVVFDTVKLPLDLQNICSFIIIGDTVVISGFTPMFKQNKNNYTHVFNRFGSLLHRFPSIFNLEKLVKIPHCTDKLITSEKSNGICYRALNGDVLNKLLLPNLIHICPDTDGKHIYVITSFKDNDCQTVLDYFEINSLIKTKSYFKSLVFPLFISLFPICPKIAVTYEFKSGYVQVFDLSIEGKVKDALLQDLNNLTFHLDSFDEAICCHSFVAHHMKFLFYYKQTLFFIN